MPAAHNLRPCGIGAGWQLTQVDEPYQQAAAAARQEQAKTLQQPAAAQAITGGDPDAVSHPSEATATPPTSESRHTMLSQDAARSTNNTHKHKNLLQSLQSTLQHFFLFLLGLISRLVSKLLYALNDILSSNEIPPWVLNAMSGLAQGLMKPKLLQLYAEGGDHSRRLSSVVANGKFSSISAGPDEPWEVRTACRSNEPKTLVSFANTCKLQLC